MPNTYTQLYIQLVFAVKGRENQVNNSFRNELEKYICGITKNHKHKPLAIYIMPDHLHFLIGLHPEQAISDLVRDVKSNSTNFINSKRWLNKKFYWQEGFGAFSYSRSQLDNVVKYILNQSEHYKKKTFRREYLEFWRNLKLIIMKNICLNFMIKGFACWLTDSAPTERIRAIFSLSTQVFAPMGLLETKFLKHYSLFHNDL